MSDDYEKGYRQFSMMVGEETMEKLASRFKSVFPGFEREVVTQPANGAVQRSTSRRDL